MIYAYKTQDIASCKTLCLIIYEVTTVNVIFGKRNLVLKLNNIQFILPIYIKLKAYGGTENIIL